MSPMATAHFQQLHLALGPPSRPSLQQLLIVVGIKVESLIRV